jgi:hypothetical protein
MQHITFMQFQRAAPRQPQGFAAAEGGLTGQQRVKMNASAAVVVEYQFVFTHLYADIERGFPAGAKRPTGAGVFVR